MMLYKIMLVLVCFGAVNGVINGLGIYNVQTPETEQVITEADVTDLSDSVSGQSVNAFTAIFGLMTILSTLWNIALSLLTIVPFLTAWGVPFGVAMMIQIPIWLVMMWGLWQMWTGQTSPAQD